MAPWGMAEWSPPSSEKCRKTKVFRMGCGCIQNYSHINYEPFPPIQIPPSPIYGKITNCASLLFLRKILLNDPVQCFTRTSPWSNLTGRWSQAGLRLWPSFKEGMVIGYLTSPHLKIHWGYCLRKSAFQIRLWLFLKLYPTPLYPRIGRITPPHTPE